jgi:hypothetical protein
VIAIHNISNIGGRGAKQRRATGIAALGLSVVLAVAFIVGNVDWYWHLVLFVPALGAMEGALQAKEST